MKIKILTAFSLSLLLLTSAKVFADSEVHLFLNNVEIQPLEQNHQSATMDSKGTLYLPIRNIFESMGATVIWDEDNARVFGGKGMNVSFEVIIGQKTAVINEQTYDLSDEVIICNSRSMTVRDMIEKCFGSKTELNGNNFYITIQENAEQDADKYTGIKDDGQFQSFDEEDI